MTIKERSGLVIEDIYALDEKTLKELFELLDRRLKQLTEDLQEV